MDRSIKITGTTAIMAQRMKASWDNVPRVTYSMSADVSNADKMINEYNERNKETGARLTYNHILMKACATASKKYELFNASVDGEEISIHESINIGLAVATDNGLLVPNVKNVDRLSLDELCAETKRIIKGARMMKIEYDDICGGTFTITNLGMYGVERFTPIINLPEVAILGVNKVSCRLEMENGSIVEKRYMPLDLVADHRIIDGALAAEYLREVVSLVENPENLDVQEVQQ